MVAYRLIRIPGSTAEAIRFHDAAIGLTAS
jgi:hypothetical protein